jgi:hypothetical protein
MKIIIENCKFPYDLGCRLLKLKHQSSPFAALDEIWDDIVPLTFREIAEMENIEDRRVGMLCLGLERLVDEVNPTLIDSRTIEKKTNFIDKDGNLVREKFNDTYELYEVKGEKFGTDKWGRTMNDCHFVKFKDTSTDRKYMIWVDVRSVYITNVEGDKRNAWWSSTKKQPINAIQSIAWTIQTNVEEGNIKEIVRQGDCVLVKPKDSNKPLLDTPRHLTEKEYLKLLVAES